MRTRFYRSRPLGAYRLASELRSHGYTVLVIDNLANWIDDVKSFLDLLSNVIGKETLFVGYSSTFFSMANVNDTDIKCFEDFYKGGLSQWPAPAMTMLRINQFIKKLNPDIKILHGGASTSPTQELKDGGVDYAVQGFADGVIVEIADCLKNKQHIRFNLKNNIKVIDYDVTASTFNFPRSQTLFHPSDIIDPAEVLPMETSRGCLFKCSFCAFPLLGRKKNHPEYHKHIDCIAEEFKRNYEDFGVTNYMFSDDTFNESTEKLEHIYTAIKQSGVNIRFHCYIRLDLLERFPEQIKLLKDMGIQSCFLGIETLNIQAAKAIGKSSHPDRVKAALVDMRKVWGNDVVVFGSFIAGLPHETEETIDTWMQWVYDHPDLINSYVIRALMIDDARVSPSDICSNPEKYGYKILSETAIGNHFKWVNNTGLSVFAAEIISTKWMEKSWSTGRLGVAGHELKSLLSLGYTFDELKNISLDQLPFADLQQANKLKFAEYQNKLKQYILST